MTTIIPPIPDDEEAAILDHTIHRAAGGRFCGDSEAMQRCVHRGWMKAAGRASWCPDEFFTITPDGRAAWLRNGFAKSAGIDPNDPDSDYLELGD